MAKGYRVTDEQKLQIKRMHEAGLFYSQIQEKTGLSRECVRKYILHPEPDEEEDPSLVRQGPGPGMHTIKH